MKIEYKDGWVYDGPKKDKPRFLGINVGGKKINEYLTQHKKDYPQYWRNTKAPTQEDGYYANTYGLKTYTNSDTSDGSRAYKDPTPYTQSKLDIFK